MPGKELADFGYQRVKCPFYKRSNGRQIVCEGPLPGTNSGISFVDAKDRSAYLNDFCRTDGCWKGCVIAAAAAEKYDTEIK